MSTREHLASALSRAVADVAARDGLDLSVEPASVHLERPAHLPESTRLKAGGMCASSNSREDF